MTEVPYPKAKAVVDEAYKIITTDRRDSYGDWETESLKVAKIWNAYLGTTNIRAVDVGPMMTLLKMIRHNKNPDHADNITDMVGYMALTAENLHE